MDWTERLNKIIDYIESSLQLGHEEIDRQRIEQLAGCSYSLFQRIFSYMNSVTLAEYIRNRKLTLAGYDFKSTEIKVLDASVKYGYDSPTAFTRAFQAFHGITPSEAKKESVVLKVYPRMNFTEANDIKWRVEHKEGFRLLGVKRSINCLNGENFRAIPAFWNEVMQNGRLAQIISYTEAHKLSGTFGVFGNYQDGMMDYYIAGITDRPAGKGLEAIEIPPAAWAVFECAGPMPGAIQKGWRFLNEEWVIKYPFDHADCPEMEWYSAGNSFAEDYKSEIWIPIL